MPRRLIALFALHFFLSVSAFAFGGAHPGLATPAHTAAVSQTAPTGIEDAAQHGTALVESAVNHALVDELPDLPDSLPRTVLAQRSPADGGRTIGYRQHAALPLPLDGLLRPPQQADHTA
ncbi:MAG: hypothetical protein ACK4NM_11485 [Hydrogenophaga sp.]|jgi:hypothetical protein